MFWANLSKPVTVHENVFDCERYVGYGGVPFNEVWVGNVGEANTKSGDYYFSIYSVACWPFTYCNLNTVELVLFDYPKIVISWVWIC